MKNILKSELYGYTVRGIDLRDDSPFKDHIVASNLNGCIPDGRLKFIRTYYDNLGFRVDYIIPDTATGYDPVKGIAMDFDLDQLYLERLEALGEQQNEPIAREGGLR